MFDLEIDPFTLRVVDGDTFECVARYETWVNEWTARRLMIRLYGGDTYELRDKDPKKKKLAQDGRRFVSDWLGKHDPLELYVFGIDNFGRALAEVTSGHRNLVRDLGDAGLLTGKWRR